jgi:hypothetical protein
VPENADEVSGVSISGVRVKQRNRRNIIIQSYHGKSVDDYV